ncbi:hypothetical protein BGZ94_007266 [Podila epigama]|nr:hypothetical protein BGZ94_007266 [Podila epigama]
MFTSSLTRLRISNHSTLTVCAAQIATSPLLPLLPWRHINAAIVTTQIRSYRRPFNWTPELDANIIELHNSGLTWSQIASKLNFSHHVSCCHRFNAVLKPQLDGIWTKERLALLEVLVLEGHPWNEIASSLQTGHDDIISVSACRVQWKNIVQLTKQTLSSEDLKQLLHGVKTYQASQAPIDWDEIARALDNKYSTHQLKIIYEGEARRAVKWSKIHEEELIKLVMDKFANSANRPGNPGTTTPAAVDWEEISKDLGHHTAQQCKDRWKWLGTIVSTRRYISPSGHFWSDEAIKAYCQAWKEHGNTWEVIADAVLLQVQAHTPTTESSSTFASKLNQDKSASSISAADCEADFKYVVRESTLRDLGFQSFEPTTRPRWTEEQIKQLLDTVQRVHDIKCQKLQMDQDKKPEPTMYTVDWDEVVRVSGLSFTPLQCRYRWDREMHPQNYVGVSAKRWSIQESKDLESALRDHGLLSKPLNGTLPRGFMRIIKEQYNIQRSRTSILNRVGIIQRKYQEEALAASPDKNTEHALLSRIALPPDDWTEEEDRQLMLAMRDMGGGHWEEISNIIFQRRKSAWLCRLRALRLKSQGHIDEVLTPRSSPRNYSREAQPLTKAVSKEWTAEEQEYLFKAVEEHGMFDSWDKVKEDLDRCRAQNNEIRARSMEEIKKEYWRLHETPSIISAPAASTPAASSSSSSSSSVPASAASSISPPSLTELSVNPYFKDTLASGEHASQQDDILSKEDDGIDDDSLVPKLSHPELFVVPGIMKKEKFPLHKRPSPVDPSPDLFQGQVTVSWKPEDEDKMLSMVEKYGTSSIGWKLISENMSIPVKKCQDKLRQIKQRKSHKDKTRRKSIEIQ